MLHTASQALPEPQTSCSHSESDFCILIIADLTHSNAVMLDLTHKDDLDCRGWKCCPGADGLLGSGVHKAAGCADRGGGAAGSCPGCARPRQGYRRPRAQGSQEGQTQGVPRHCVFCCVHPPAANPPPLSSLPHIHTHRPAAKKVCSGDDGCGTGYTDACWSIIWCLLIHFRVPCVMR